jgi:hypothetical protein
MTFAQRCTPVLLCSLTSPEQFVHDEQLYRQPFPSRTYVGHPPLHILTIRARTAVNQLLRTSAALTSHALIAVGTAVAVYALSTVGVTSTTDVPIVVEWDLLLKAFLGWTWHNVSES